MPIEDAELVRRVADGDTDALRVLYDRYGPLVHGMSYRLLGDGQLAEECTQDVFVSLWRAAGRYEPERAKVTTWLFAVARNTAISVARKRAARPVQLVEDLPHAAHDSDPAQLAAEADYAERVAGAMSELPEPQLEVIRLAYFDGLSHTEIAESLNVPLGTVKGRIRLGLDRLRSLLPRHAVEAEERR